MALALLALHPETAQAQTEEIAEKLTTEDIVVTPLRAEESSLKIAANVTVITEEDIQNSTATTVQDILRDSEGILVRDLYGTGTKTVVDSRGFARGLNTVILIDGRKVNEVDLSGVDWNLIPLENIERIEIVRGGATVLYGDNATSGAINIITKKGKAGEFAAEVALRGESFSGVSEHINIRGGSGMIGFSLLAKNKETDGYRDNSEFDSEDISGKLNIALMDKLFIELSGGWHEDHQGLPGGLTEAELAADRKQSTNPTDYIDYEQHYYRLVAAVSVTDNTELELSVAHNNREFDSILFADFGFGQTSFQTVRNTKTDELKLKLTSRHKILGKGNLFVIGADLFDTEVDNVTQYDEIGFSSTTTSDINKEELGYYIQDELFLTDKLTLTLGARYSIARFDDSVVDVNTFGSSSGSGSKRFKRGASKASITYNHMTGGKLFASYSKGYRSPTTDELFSYDGTITLLKPERTEAVEFGIVQPIGKAVTTSLTLYNMKVRDEIFLNPAVGFFGTNENIDETRHRGAELGVNANIGKIFSINGNWTYTDTTFESGTFDGKHMPLIAKNSANLSATIRPVEHVALNVNANWVGERYIENDTANTQDKLDDHTTVDAKLSVDYKWLTIFLGVNNIFDKEYSEYAVVNTSGTVKNFYPAPERWYYGGIKAVF
jgi:iron complex outermembrane receptor protein